MTISLNNNILIKHQRVHSDFYWIFLSSMLREIAPLSVVQSMKDEIVATLLTQF